MQARLNAARVVCIGSLLLLGACGGGGAGGAGAPVADLTGSWSVTESGVSDCAGQASYTFGPAQITITQSGNDLTVVGPAGTFSGSIDGDRAGRSGSYPSGDGTTTITSMALTVAADGGAFSGSANGRGPTVGAHAAALRNRSTPRAYRRANPYRRRRMR